MIGPIVIIFAGMVGLMFMMMIWASSRYKRCPADRILVVYGKTAQNQGVQCMHGGAAFVWPVIQDFAFLDLTPIAFENHLNDIFDKNNKKVNLPSEFVVGISNQPGLMEKAADRLLALDRNGIRSLSEKIIEGQLNLVISDLDIDEMIGDRKKFIDHFSTYAEQELNKIGMHLIHVNIRRISEG